ncbi:HipA family kinase [Amycolatopsis sp. NPDC051903]|uniref:HipA family kinase n=1 Tax=Amycolatopsis sp. NPDC051903 TaxID=3363936 RepID=UPI003793F3D6
MMERVRLTRYVSPFREGGSLPGLMEADDLGSYVVKFRGAGQGPKVLVAEVLCAGLAGVLGLPVPRLVEAGLDAAFGRLEADPEIQDLLRASTGPNLGVDFLPGALDFSARAFPVDPVFASRVLWFDALTNNVDRSWRNPNLLWWHRKPVLIDHGAALTFHYNWAGAGAFATRPYAADDHVLLGFASGVDTVDTADAALAPLLDEDALRTAAAAVPDAWLEPEAGFGSAQDLREAYVTQLSARLRARDAWLAPLREAVSGVRA